MGKWGDQDVSSEKNGIGSDNTVESDIGVW